MARPKKVDSHDPEFLIAEGFRALSHPSRLEILRHLSNQDSCCAGDFCCCMAIAQSTISQHLDILKSCGIVEWKSQGTKSIFSLNREKIAELSKALEILAGTQAVTEPDVNADTEKAHK